MSERNGEEKEDRQRGKGGEGRKRKGRVKMVA